MCNDNLGCADESDEEPVLCNRTIPVQPVGEGECRLPRAPANGRISIIGCENTPFEEICQAGSGFPVGQYISVRFECNRGYTLRGEASSTCIDGKWEPQVPVCQLVSESDGDACPPLRSKTLDIQCKDKDGNTVSCNNRVPVGSTASFQCREGYTQPIFPYDQIECRSPGTWSSSLLSCLPDVCCQGSNKPQVPSIPPFTPTSEDNCHFLSESPETQVLSTEQLHRLVLLELLKLIRARPNEIYNVRWKNMLPWTVK